MLPNPTKFERSFTPQGLVFHIFSTLDWKFRLIFEKTWKILDYPFFLYFQIRHNKKIKNLCQYQNSNTSGLTVTNLPRA